MQLVLTTELLIEAYKQGLFPMAYNAGSPFIHWVCPELRGQLSIPRLHIRRSLKKVIKRGLIEGMPYHVTTDKAFEAVIGLCAESVESRPETWINDPIRKAYINLHHDGFAHSVEIWREGSEGNELVGGLYGIAIGGAFFGESMFSRATDASKIALVHLCARLHKGGFTLLDTQFVNDHLQQFGVYELPHREYMKDLREAVKQEADFKLADITEANLLKAYPAYSAAASESRSSA
ncbi:MAG: leucyl/phenylalanyl-tRNA--protein transferase [Alphaproteobacteria bacterium]|nr:leucyl/phenylalanyl-tRNA--protein transferase [Alphaproteobacteria bacterium]MCD8520098.1 leucyl/phenylalanyl-tRNA--protein transferase [Alphaproteobacteria bacterium]MCD8525875.1 leucyl/phenylalanyl-tRNA--protein transferase [Alphaproteobacteria bacterium]MCD8570735.1 leucyl/phenylalanyl-tRNA--protein transferase [Alphaproteobacteria bacterium]